MPKGKLITDPEQKYQALHKQRVHSAQKGDIPLPPQALAPSRTVMEPYLRIAKTIKQGRANIAKAGKK